MKGLRFLLFPIAGVYYLITSCRNFLYNSKIWKSYLIPVKSICIGNLSLGGTGKSPLVAFIAEKLMGEHKIQILSRGYGRKTRGYHLVSPDSTSDEVGDEPLMYKKRFKETISVVVCESRTEGIKTILKNSKPDVVILDDAFQHRKVTAGFSILLTDYSKPFYSDYLVPTGNLRESRQGKNRADVILVSKCPANLDIEKKEEFSKKLGFPKEKVYFSSISYLDLISFSEKKEAEIEHILLVTGIANPTPLQNFLSSKYRVEMMTFKDHHQFSLADMEKICKKFDTFAHDKKAIVTSEKDYVRLVAPEFSAFISEKPWYYQAISIEIDRENEFINQIKKYVDTI